MALATKCPHCNTIFRVAADQLKLRGGIVRCGTCKEVFDGNAALLDPAAPLLPVAGAAPAVMAQPAVPAPAPQVIAAATPAPAPSGLPEHTSDDFPLHGATPPASEAVYALDFDTSFDPFGILPETAQAVPDTHAIALPPVPAPAEAEPALELDLDTNPLQPAQPELPPLAAPFRRRQAEEAPAFATYLRDSRREPQFDASPPAETPAAEAATMAMQGISLAKAEPSFDAVATVETATAPAAVPASLRQEPSWEPPHAASLPAAEPVPDAEPAEAQEPEQELDEPAFVTQGRRREQSGKALRVAMAAGSVFLLLLLLLQVMTTFRNPLAAQFPQFKPALSALCSISGCQVALPAQIEALAIEQGELQTLAPQTFSYVSLLRNHSRSVQAWPSIELTLNDSNDKPVVRRVFAPRDYLPAHIAVAGGLAPRSEQTIKLYFTLAQASASGYHIAIFYP